MKFEKIKLNKLAENSLADREMTEIKGGSACIFGCKYAGQGSGSSNASNGSANNEHGYYSPGGGTWGGLFLMS